MQKSSSLNIEKTLSSEEIFTIPVDGEEEAIPDYPEEDVPHTNAEEPEMKSKETLKDIVLEQTSPVNETVTTIEGTSVGENSMLSDSYDHLPELLLTSNICRNSKQEEKSSVKLGDFNVNISESMCDNFFMSDDDETQQIFEIKKTINIIQDCKNISEDDDPFNDNSIYVSEIFRKNWKLRIKWLRLKLQRKYEKIISNYSFDKNFDKRYPAY